MSEKLFEAITKNDLKSVKEEANKDNINILYKFTPLAFACKQENIDLEIIKHLFSIGADLNLPINFTPLIFAIQKGDIPLVEFLLDNGADPNIPTKKVAIDYAMNSSEDLTIIKKLISSNVNLKQVDSGSTILHRACEGETSKTKIEFLLDKGFSVNDLNQTPLHILLKQYSEKTPRDSFRLLLKHADFWLSDCVPIVWNATRLSKKDRLIDIILAGAPIDILYNSQDLTNNANEDTKKIILSFRNICKELETFYSSKFLTDFKIMTKHESFPCHKHFLLARIGNKEKMDKFIEGIQDIEDDNIVVEIIKWVYSGEQPKNEESIKTCEKYGIDLSEKSARNSLLLGLKQLYLDEESKDFGIKVDDQIVKIHKFLLSARSDLYLHMFESVNDPSSTVQDYSGKSLKAIQILVQWMYFDSIDPDTPLDVLEELDNAADFYQLHEDSSFETILRSFLPKKDSNELN
ncbi:ankyrin repeat-containing protein [Anaeramoeba ignava]|uniref:Ankyrin repeat-containing protein n=1 Tax=Anaeramoeba ignava TaxID=1746090 RepID=A0A9Q0L7I7_ANAIG|nr:ankyrin repeat-containing protein [Anaeramoeba ignava]